MSKLLLASLIADRQYVVALKYDFASAKVAAALKSAGLQVKLYSGKTDGRIQDLARQLIRMRSDVYVLFGNSQFESELYQIARSVNELRPNTSFVFALPESEKALVSLTALKGIGRVIFYDSIENCADNLARNSGFDSTNQPIDSASSPYDGDILTVFQAPELGISALCSNDSIKRDVEVLERQKMNIDKAIPVRTAGLSNESIVAFLALLREQAPTIRYRLECDPTVVTSDLVEAAISSGITDLFYGQVSVALPSGDIRDTQKWISGYVMRCTGTRAHYGRNGVAALHSGIYGDTSTGPGIHHLELGDGMTPMGKQSARNNFSQHMMIRSADIVTENIEIRQNGGDDHQGDAIDQHPNWPRHRYTFQINSKEGSVTALFDNDSIASQRIRYVPFGKIGDEASEADEMVVITLRTKEDVRAFRKSLEIFHQTGEIENFHSSKPVTFENSCRWLGLEACSVTSLRRLQLDKSGGVTACRDTPPFARSEQSFEALIGSLKETKALSAAQRECYSCPVRDQCSKCSQLPEEWAGEYCAIRQEFPQVPLFVLMAMFPQVVRNHLAADVASRRIRVSGAGLPRQFYKGPIREARTGQMPVIVTIETINFAWWPGTRRLMKLSDPLAVISEGWWNGATDVEISEELSRLYNVSPDIAAQNYATALTILANENVITSLQTV